MGWIVDGFLRLQFDEFMSLPVAGFSRVHKPTSWFALHFIYERGVYLVLVTQRQQASTICLLPWGWPSSVTPFFYIKPQRGDKTTIQPKVVLYRFSTSNHNVFSAGVFFWGVLYRFCTSNHNHLETISRFRSVVLYRFSTSNHNCTWYVNGAKIVVLYRFSTSNHNLMYKYWAEWNVVLYRFSTSNHNRTQ